MADVIRNRFRVFVIDGKQEGRVHAYWNRGRCGFDRIAFRTGKESARANRRVRGSKGYPEKRQRRNGQKEIVERCAAVLQGERLIQTDGKGDARADRDDQKHKTYEA